MRACAVVGEAGATMKPGESVDYVGRGVGTHTSRTAIGSHGEDVGGSTNRGNCGPATVVRERHVLDLGRGVAAVQDVQVVHGGKLRTKRMRLDSAISIVGSAFINFEII